MPRQYSSKTLDLMARFIDAQFTHTQMGSLFLNVSIPNNFDFGPNKLARGLNVIKGLWRSEEGVHAEILDALFNEAVNRRPKAFEADEWNSPDQLAISLQRALRADGYEMVEGKIVPADALEFELAAEISLLEGRLQEYGMQDVIKTLDQAHQNFVDGHFEACNAMLRTSLESTLKHAAVRTAGGESDIPMTNPAYGLTPADVRKYLRQGFFTQDETDFVKEFYGYASTEGSHPGLSNESESRLRRLMIVAVIQYCLEKLESQHP